MNTEGRIKKIKEVSKNLNNYLEIGVHRGVTFNQLDFEYKVAVDPKFAFEYQSVASDKVIFHEMTSDNFFIGNNKKILFDVIFLDGLHEYKQTYRDFINALQSSHDKTIFIIDDVYPNDVYSSLLDSTVKQRSLADPKNNDKSWHGDVYKSIGLIHDLHPLISFKTIKRGYGNPQTFLYKKPRKNFRPMFANLEQIDRLDYFSLINDDSFMNLASEGEVLQEIISFLGES